MKKIRLEIPLDVWKDLPSQRIWLKVGDDKTETFEDREWSTPISNYQERVVLSISVPKELKLIEVVGLGGTTPVQDISLGWCMESVNPNWRLPGLQKVSILTAHSTYEVPVINEKPDRKNLDQYISYDSEGAWLCFKSWAMAIYTFENETIATLHWHPKLVEEYLQTIRKITLSSKKQHPCLWEKGGKITDRKGSATIICDTNGRKKKPIFVKRKGHLSCGEHALFVVHVGDVIVEAVYQEFKNSFTFNLLQIDSIDIPYCEAKVHSIGTVTYPSKGLTRKRIEEFPDDKWINIPIDGKYKDAILAAYEKAICYHCKRPFFIG